MSTNDILRKYLDILKEDEDKAQAPASSSDMPSSDKIQIAPPKGAGSIEAVIEAIKDFQQATGEEPADGIPRPTTMAKLLSQSGRLGRDEAKKLEQGGPADKEPTAIAENIEAGDRHQVLLNKAALHEGYAQGLRGHEAMCPHAVGTGEHSYHLHGHGLGLKECGGVWTKPMPSAM